MVQKLNVFSNPAPGLSEHLEQHMGQDESSCCLEASCDEKSRKVKADA